MTAAVSPFASLETRLDAIVAEAAKAKLPAATRDQHMLVFQSHQALRQWDAVGLLWSAFDPYDEQPIGDDLWSTVAYTLDGLYRFTVAWRTFAEVTR